jgi:SAM-dependent methyltransferase
MGVDMPHWGRARTDRAWERLGQSDPYFGVISNDAFHTPNLTDDAIDEFFRTGHVHVDKVLAIIRDHIDPQFKPKAALDFGCGVGRIVIPLAAIAEHVTAVDISQSMLDEARRNCAARETVNVDFIKAEGNRPFRHKKFDFVHSFLVLQHITAARGERIFANLVSSLDDGGIGAIHVKYSTNSAIHRTADLLTTYVPLSGNLMNICVGRRWDGPVMEMHSYDLNRLFHVIEEAGVKSLHCEYTGKDHELGVFLFFQKASGSTYAF